MHNANLGRACCVAVALAAAAFQQPAVLLQVWVEVGVGARPGTGRTRLRRRDGCLTAALLKLIALQLQQLRQHPTASAALLLRLRQSSAHRRLLLLRAAIVASAAVSRLGRCRRGQGCAGVGGLGISGGDGQAGGRVQLQLLLQGHRKGGPGRRRGGGRWVGVCCGAA